MIATYNTHIHIYSKWFCNQSAKTDLASSYLLSSSVFCCTLSAITTFHWITVKLVWRFSKWREKNTQAHTHNKTRMKNCERERKWKKKEKERNCAIQISFHCARINFVARSQAAAAEYHKLKKGVKSHFSSLFIQLHKGGSFIWISAVSVNSQMRSETSLAKPLPPHTHFLSTKIPS